MIDLEIKLAKAFHWSVYEMDHTNAFSMLTFITRFAERERQPQIFADEATWL